MEPLEPAPAPSPPPPRVSAADRTRVLMEILWVSVGVALLVDLFLELGWWGFHGPVSEMRAWQLMAVILAQNLLAVVFIVAFLRIQGKSLRYLGFGRGSTAFEVGLGILLAPVALILAVIVEAALLRWVPGLHNVEVNPILNLIRGPGDALALLVGSVLAGGLGEETIRAFILRRFGTHLGGMALGLSLWSVVFGALHLAQGLDKAIVVGLLGLMLGVLYAWRRNPVAPMALHSAFNATQTLLAYYFLNAG